MNNFRHLGRSSERQEWAGNGSKTTRSRRPRDKTKNIQQRGFCLDSSAIRIPTALGVRIKSLTKGCGIRAGLQFHLPPVFRPLPHDL